MFFFYAKVTPAIFSLLLQIYNNTPGKFCQASKSITEVTDEKLLTVAKDAKIFVHLAKFLYGTILRHGAIRLTFSVNYGIIISPINKNL